MAAIEPLFCRPSWTLVNPTELVPDLDLLTVQVVHGNGVDADQAQRDLGQPYKAGTKDNFVADYLSRIFSLEKIRAFFTAQDMHNMSPRSVPDHMFRFTSQW